jgi:hypothetical protein
VNVASRCEALNKTYNTKTIIGHRTYIAVCETFLCSWLGSVYLRGKQNQENVYEVKGYLSKASERDIQICKIHENIHQAYSDMNRERLIELSNILLEIDPNDVTARTMLDENTGSSSLAS